MSKLFYDHLIVLTEVESAIKAQAETEEERHELWQIVDEIIHLRMLELFLNRLAEKHHDEFLEKFHKRPHDESLIDYLNEKIGENIEDIILQELGDFSYELLGEIKSSKK